jgi:hypothetical protein
MAWPPSVNVYEENNPTKYTDMNKPLADLIARTDWLKQQIDQVTAGKNLVALYDNVSEDVSVGDAVYLDTSDGTLKPALAGFASAYAADGSLRLAESGYITGFVTDKPNAASAYVVTSGTYSDQALADIIFGGGASAGIYRLSMTNAGEVTATEQELDILAVQYDGAGSMTLFDKRASIPNHIHQAYSLDQVWLAESDSQFDDMEKPAGATFGYDLANDSDLQRLFPQVPGYTRIFADGNLLSETEVIANKDNIWWVDATLPTPTVPTDYTELEAFITTPYTFGEPILRGARSDTPTEIVLSADQGILTANMASWSTVDGGPSAKAVIGLSGREATLGSVVSSVEVIGDLEKSESAQGAVTLSLGEGINRFIEPYITNLNNAVEASDGYYTYYALPAGRDASMLGRISIPYFSGASLEAAVIAEVYGLAGGGAIPALTVEHSAKAYPSSQVAMNSAWDDTFTLPTPSIDANNTLIVEALEADRFLVTSRGTVYVSLGFDNGLSEDIRIVRFGVILYTV